MNKKLITITISLTLFLAGCGQQAPSTPNTPNTPSAPEVTTTKSERDQVRLDNITLITSALSQYLAKTGEYAPAEENMCADHLIKLFEETNSLKADLYKIRAPKTPFEENLECPLTGIYYFFRDENPNHYNFAVKMEDKSFGVSDIEPKEIKNLTLEELKPIRQATQNGQWYYIIGNYPIELLQD